MPYLPLPGMAWQVAQSFLKTACRSTFANAMPRMRSASDKVGTTGGKILICNVSVLLPLSVAMFTVLNKVPLLPARFTVRLIWPFAPGDSSHGIGGNCAVVQPQDGWTLTMATLP